MAEERAHLGPAPDEPYDVPVWTSARVHFDQHAQVLCSLYSVPSEYRSRTLEARADSRTVRFYLDRKLVKTHPRVERGKRSTDRADFPPEKAAYAFRDRAWLEKKAREQGAAIGALAGIMLRGPAPWTNFRRVQGLLGLSKRYGVDRVEAATALLLEAGATDLKRLKRVLEQGSRSDGTSLPSGPVAANARFLRSPSTFAIPRGARGDTTTNEGETTCPTT